MKKGKLQIGLTVLCSIGMYLYCSDNATIAGGSSDTEVSAQISGIASNVHGEAIADAVVRLRLKDYLPGSALSKKKMVLSNKIDAVTDKNGYFQIDSVDSGSYLLEITSGDTVGSIVEYTVNGIERCTIAPVLAPLGMVVGRMEFSYEGQDIISRARVELIGTETMTRPDSNGFFMLPVAVPRLPAGALGDFYRIRLSVDSSFFTDMVISVELDSSNIGDLGIVRLNYSLPPPCMDGRCDSMVLRHFLDSAGYPGLPVSDVAVVRRGRIEELRLRGIALPISLALIGSISNLMLLDLGNTGTADSCRFIMNLWNLKVLRLDSNAITGLSHAFEGAFGLRELDLTANRLTNLPERITALTQLLKLNLEDNELCNISPAIVNWAGMLDPGWREKQRCP